MKSALCLVSVVILAGCEDAFLCGDGCDGGAASQADAGISSRNVVVAAPLVLDSRPISNGIARATVTLTPATNVDVPASFTGSFLAPPQADLRVGVQIKYTSPLLGGAAVGQVVPYLRVDADITNMDTRQSMHASLVPVVSLDSGIHHARNIALKDTLGSAQSNYSMTVTIRRPAWFGDPDVETFSPGIVRDADLVDQETGTFLGERAVTIRTHFSLDDLLNAGTAPATGTAPSTGSSSGGGGYIAP
jgi:uncharacterized protein involved in high-affinity Fe2+ transport